MQFTTNQSPIARNKLLLLACFVGIGSILLVGWVAVERSTKALLSQGKESLRSIRQVRTTQVEDYFRMIRSQVEELARSRMIGQAVIDFSAAFDEENKSPSLPIEFGSEAHRSLTDYYHNEFATRLSTDQITHEQIEKLIPIEPASKILQYLYLSDNPNKVGEKDALVISDLDFEYGRVHAIYHPIIRAYLKSFEYYDIFLFDLHGHVVYSVFKETDFATNFKVGPYRDTNLGDVYRRACDSSTQGESHLQDFTAYLPSYDAPASFIACPIHFEGKKVGVVAFQMPLKRINDILQQGIGLGVTGESFLVGNDKKMRTDSRLSTESTLLKIQVDSEPVQRAIRGETGACINTSYRGRTVASSYSPVNIKDLRWAAVAEIELAELLIPAYRLRDTMLYSGLTIGVLAILVSLVASRFLSNDKQDQELLHSACMDKLTGLPNRYLFLNRLNASFQRYSKNPTRNLALLFLDFDRFKAINDALGHAAGDLLLQEIANRLRSSLNLSKEIADRTESITAARLGGDEFVILLDIKDYASSAHEIAMLLLKIFEEPYYLAGEEVCSTASIGVAQCNPQYRQAEDLLRDADAAMYEAKKKGKACFAMFDQAMQNKLSERRKLESDLKTAMVEQQFVVNYQPVFNLLDGRIHSVDAVIAWNHPQRGLVPAIDFIEVADEIDLALPISQWLIQKACVAQAGWMRSFGDLAPKFINIPLPTRSCFSSEIIEVIDSAISFSGISIKNLQLEFPESALTGSFKAAEDLLKALRFFGVCISIDEFCSSASMLVSGSTVAIDSITIGRPLISQIEESQSVAAFVHSLSLLAHNLKLSTVANGINTVQQLLAVRTIGCQFGKGEYLGKPVTAATLGTLLQTSNLHGSTVSGALTFLPSMHQGIEVIPIH